MLIHQTIPSTFKTNLLKKKDHYCCPECLIHFAAAPQFCWFCGVQFQNSNLLKEKFSREEPSI